MNLGLQQAIPPQCLYESFKRKYQPGWSSGKRGVESSDDQRGDALASNRLNEDDVTVRFYAQTAIVNGSESWKQKDGKTGRFIWTDVFVKRNAKWQVVSSHDLEVLDKQ